MCAMPNQMAKSVQLPLGSFLVKGSQTKTLQVSFGISPRFGKTYNKLSERKLHTSSLPAPKKPETEGNSASSHPPIPSCLSCLPSHLQPRLLLADAAHGPGGPFLQLHICRVCLHGSHQHFQGTCLGKTMAFGCIFKEFLNKLEISRENMWIEGL